jgi:hypothetical protein
MLKSAQNFTAGFFGIPYENQYQQLVTIEHDGVRPLLSPSSLAFAARLTRARSSTTCSRRTKADRGTVYVRQWAEVFLADAKKRIQPVLEGYTLVAEDVHSMMQMCAYEVCALSTYMADACSMLIGCAADGCARLVGLLPAVHAREVGGLRLRARPVLLLRLGV